MAAVDVDALLLVAVNELAFAVSAVVGVAVVVTVAAAAATAAAAADVCEADDEDFCDPDVVILSTLHDIDVKTAQYNADIAHFDNCTILLGVNGSNIGNDRANDSTDTSDEICGKQLLIANASACVTGKYNGLP